jgi:MYXO-CTERM domain-containing protein
MDWRFDKEQDLGRKLMKRSFAMVAAVLLSEIVGAISAGATPITTVNLGALTSPITISGTLATQDQVIEDMFTLGLQSSLTIFTTSYGGGTNVSGTTTGPGGFEPMISLYNGAGNFIIGEEVTSPIAHADPSTKLALDAYLFDPSLAPGTYIAVLTDWLNQQPPTATNLSDGFVDLGAGGSTFVDEQLNARNANYTLNFSAAPVSSVPEPASAWLVLVALLGVAVIQRRRGAF